jgi:hypothetical protein
LELEVLLDHFITNRVVLLTNSHQKIMQNFFVLFNSHQERKVNQRSLECLNNTLLTEKRVNQLLVLNLSEKLHVSYKLRSVRLGVLLLKALNRKEIDQTDTVLVV